MALRLLLVMAMVVVATVVECNASNLAYHHHRHHAGLVGYHIDPAEEMMMESETSRRVLQDKNHKYISYSALKKDSTPCSKRGNSYYNCQSGAKANPYRRGCSQITLCKRDDY